MKDPQPISLTIDTKLLRAQIDELEKKVTEVREARTILAGVAKMAEIAKTKPPDGRGQWQFQFDFDFADNCEPGDNAGLFANLRAEPRHGMILVSKTKVKHHKGASRMLWRSRKERKSQKRAVFCPSVRIETK